MSDDKPEPSRRRPIIIVSAVLAVVVGLGLGFLIPVGQPGLEVSQSFIGGEFEMVNHLGETVTQETFKGRHMLVYFGYTFCPDVCPT
jgi:cytochrome oxidase Cu insertion factor (SCO1/SenC/PrrC family)